MRMSSLPGLGSLPPTSCAQGKGREGKGREGKGGQVGHPSARSQGHHPHVRRSESLGFGLCTLLGGWEERCVGETAGPTEMQHRPRGVVKEWDPRNFFLGFTNHHTRHHCVRESHTCTRTLETDVSCHGLSRGITYINNGRLTQRITKARAKLFIL
ncbi:hypothetical protein BHM03_00025755 [Ensete ventricosum]|nr:hypothetical protein BHM03_00025755 [Ensete ventricosum]